MLQVDEDMLLRPLEVVDAEPLFNLVKKNERFLQQWLPWAYNYQLKTAEEFIARAQHLLDEQTALHLGIFQKEQIIGCIDLHEMDHELKCCKVGYWLSQNENGKGIMNRSLKKLMRYVFTDVKFNKIELHYNVHNTASAKVAASCGFKIEGVLRDSMLHHGAYADKVITGILRKEFTA